MATYNHVFSLNFTHADKKQILKALKVAAAYIDQANLSDAIETGWADVIEEEKA